MKISIISPVYGAADLLEELVSEIRKSVSKLTDDYEIILVEDNSPDGSWEIIENIAKTNEKVKGISFSRNFGQQEAIHAGMEYSLGDIIVTMDCDLQDNPEEIINMYNKSLEGYDIVLASRVDRKDGALKKIFSKLFYGILNYLIDVDIDPTVANFVLYRREALDAVLSMGDYYIYYPYMVNWIGFKKCIFPIKHAKRKDNKKTSYSVKKRFRLAFITIISFSDKPLRMVLSAGILIVMITLIFVVVLVVRYLKDDISVPGWMSIFVSLWFIGGLIISVLGMVGIYVGKIFGNVKNRPSYIIRKVTKNS